MSSPSAFERRAGAQGPTGPTGPGGPSGPTGPPSPAITLSGNTTGTLTLVSTGTVTLAGGNNITLSQSGNHITISGAAQSVQPETQTFIGGIRNSETTYTSGTVRLSELGAVTVRSTTGNAFQISVAAQSVQPETQTFVAGVSASDTLYTSGNVRITGVGGGITVSSNTGQRIDLSVAAQSVQAETQTFIGGIQNSETTYTSGSVKLSVVGGPMTIRSTTGNAFQFSAATQSVQAETQTFVGGIANSQTTYTSGTVTLSELGAITVRSTTGNQYQLSVNAQTNQAGSVYASSNTFGTSSGTYDARSISIAGRGAVSVAASNSGWIISAPAQSVQAETQTFVGGIANSQTTYTSGTVSLSELGAVTIRSTTGNQFQVSVAAQSVQAETQTFVGGIANSQTTYTSGTVSLSELGAITIRSTTGNQYQVSVNAQTVQTQNLIDVTLSGNTAGAMALVSSGTLTLAGGNNITLSQAGNAVTISGGAGGAFSAGMSTEGNTAGNTGVTGSRLVLVGTGPISLSQTTGAAGGTVSINAPATSSLSATGAVSISVNASTISIGAPAQTVQTQNLHNVTLSGNSTSAGAGYIQVSSGTLTLAGGNNVTLSQNGNAVTISAAAQSVQAETQTFIGGIQNSETTYTSGSVKLSVVGGPMTIRSTTGNAFQFSVSQSVQAETQTAVSGIANSQTTYTSGTVSLSELGAVTIRSTTGNQFQVSVNSQTEQTQSRFNLTLSGNSTSGGAGYIQISSGVMTLAGGNNITLSQAGNAVTVSAAGGPETQVAISGIANSQTTYTSGTVSLSELGAITIRSTTGNQYQLSVNAQTNQSGNVYASSNTFGTSSGTYDARSISIAGRGAVSVAASNSGWIISAPAQTAQTGISAISNSNTTYTSGTIGLSELGAITIRSTTGNQFQFSVNSQTVQTQNIMQVTASGNRTSGGGGYVVISTGTMALAGGPNVTLSQDANTISISAGAGGGGVAIAGSNTTYTSGTALFTGVGGGVTVSSNTGQRIDISVAAPVAQTNQAGSLYVVTNTSGTSSGTYDARTLSIAAAGALTAAASNSGFIISAPATSSLSASGGIVLSTNGSTISIGYAANQPDWENYAMGNAQLASHVSAFSKTPIYWLDNIDGNLTAKSLALKISMVTASQPLSVSVHLGVYTHVNSTSVARLGSVSEAFVVSSATSVSLSGVRALIMTGIGTHATLSTISGGVYVLGLMFSATATNAMNFSLYGAGPAGGPLGGLYPGTNNVSAGTSQGIQALAGRGSTTVNAMPANVQASEVVNYGQGASMQLHPWIYIRS